MGRANPTQKGAIMAPRRKKIYEGKAKILYEGTEPGTLIQYFKDDATAFNAQKKAVIEGKGVLNNRLSEFFMQGLGNIGVPTHFIRRINMREQLIRQVEIIPLEVIVRNFAAGSLSKRLGMEEGTQLPRPIVEYSFKNDELGDPMINDYHIAAMNLATPEQMEKVSEYALKTNEILSPHLKEKGLELIDFKLEFGLYKGEVILGDEISPDTCRFWDSKTGEKMDKDRFRRDLGNVEEAYKEVLYRLTGER